MSECTHNCSTCSQNCSSRKEPESLIEKPHELSNIKKVIDYALEASFEIERKNVIKTIFKDNDKEKNNDIKHCVLYAVFCF